MGREETSGLAGAWEAHNTTLKAKCLKLEPDFCVMHSLQAHHFLQSSQGSRMGPVKTNVSLEF